jgi:hypothetical protein
MERLSNYAPRKRKRQRKQRGQKRQRGRKRYLANPGLHRYKSKQRYRINRINPRFKRKKRFYRKHRQMHRRIGSDPQDPCIYFLMPDGEGDFDGGCVTALWGGSWTVEFQMIDGPAGEMGIDEFLATAVMEDEEDVNDFHDVLERAATASQGSDEEIGWTLSAPGEAVAEDASFEKPDPVRLATRHLAFNKEQPSELLSQLVKVLSKAEDEAEGDGQDRLSEALTDVKGMTRRVSDAWSRRKEE